jgi:hypothetical protein
MRGNQMPPRRIPAKYLEPLRGADRAAQRRSIERGEPRPHIASYKSRESKWIRAFRERYGRPVTDLAFVDAHLLQREGAEQVLKRGRGAYYSSGSRPNQTPQSWARARLASVLLGGPARRADRDLWKKYRIPQGKPLYKPFPSQAKHKKYSVYVKKDGRVKLIHFGDLRYQHFRDKLGVYKHLDHEDNKRRERYYTRHGKATGRDSAKYWSHRILW